METVIKSLVQLAEYLDNQGKLDYASQIDKVANSLLTIKTAQYVGFQGYAIRNSRCWSNCYRHKRTSKPKMAAQEVWTECQKEYVESLNNDGSKWDKYASDSKMIKSAQIKIADKQLHQEFGKLVTAKINDGQEFPKAVYASLNELQNTNVDVHAIEKCAEASSKLQNIFNTNLDIDAKIKVAEINANMIKESQGFFSSMFDRFRGQGTQNFRAEKGVADVAEKIIKEMNTKTTKLIDSIKEMYSTLDKQQSSMQYFAKINKDAATDAKIKAVITQMQQAKPALAKIFDQINYMIGTINNSVAQVAGRVPAAPTFTPTSEMQQIKAIFQAHPAIAQGVMNHVYGGGPGPTKPATQKIVAYMNSLDQNTKLALQDWLRS